MLTPSHQGAAALAGSARLRCVYFRLSLSLELPACLFLCCLSTSLNKRKELALKRKNEELELWPKWDRRQKLSLACLTFF